MQPVLPTEKRKILQAGFRLLKGFAEDQQGLLALGVEFGQPPCGARSGQPVDFEGVWDRLGNVRLEHRKCGEVSGNGVAVEQNGCRIAQTTGGSSCSGWIPLAEMRELRSYPVWIMGDRSFVQPSFSLHTQLQGGLQHERPRSPGKPDLHLCG